MTKPPDMKKTTISVYPDDLADYEARKSTRPDLDFYTYVHECITFRRRYSDEVNLEPSIAAQQRLMLQLETFSTLIQANGLIDHPRLERHSKVIGEQITAQLRHLEHQSQQSAIAAIETFRIRVTRAFALGALTGSLVALALTAGFCWLL